MTDQPVEKPDKKRNSKLSILAPLIILILVIMAIIGVYSRIQSKLPPGLPREVAKAEDILGKYGVTADDLKALVAEKMGEPDYEKLMEKIKDMAPAKKPESVVNVVTLEMVPSTIRDRLNLPGTIEPWIQLEVLCEVSGKVEKKALEDGDRVQKGDIIAVLDDRDYQHVYNSAKASYEAALALKNRLLKLQKGQLSTRTQLDEAVAQVEAHKAAMETAALNIERCTIKAPISGVINKMYIDKGQFLNASMKVAEILQIDQVKVSVGIPESDVDAVRKLTDFDVTIDALGGKTFSAKKYFLSQTANEMAHLYNLDLILPNPNGEILPDMFVRVEIIKTEAPKSLAVPLYSVISRNNVNFVYVVKDGKAYSRRVRLGLQEAWRIQIAEGLKPGDRVVVIGHRNVNDEQTVNVVRNVLNAEEIVR